LLLHELLFVRKIPLEEIRRCWLAALRQPLLHDQAPLLPPFDRLVRIIRILLSHLGVESSNGPDGTLAIYISAHLLGPGALRLLVAAAGSPACAHGRLQGVQIYLLSLPMRQSRLGRLITAGIQTTRHGLLMGVHVIGG
jgi:hypothetical protein